MSELLEIFDLHDNLVGVQDRQEFYWGAREEFTATGKISHKVKTIRVLIMNSEGRIYLQKRSGNKTDNAGLFDKTIGGHVTQGESPILTVVRECAEELGFPAAVLSSEEFEAARHSIDLSVIGILYQVDQDKNFISIRKTQQGDFPQPLISYFYIGCYDGAIKFKDGEASGIETLSPQELEEALRRSPEKFTHDLSFMFSKFRKYLRNSDIRHS